MHNILMKVSEKTLGNSTIMDQIRKVMRIVLVLFSWRLSLVSNPVSYLQKGLITCIYNLNYYLISLIFMLILCNYDACNLNFMNFLHWYAILLKLIFMPYLGLL